MRSSRVKLFYLMDRISLVFSLIDIGIVVIVSKGGQIESSGTSVSLFRPVNFTGNPMRPEYCSIMLSNNNDNYYYHVIIRPAINRLYSQNCVL